MFGGHPDPTIPPFGHWLRHIAAVPKGFLRYKVLELLSEKPLSGSEIMNEIGKQTNGCWKPSPGSIYPLLAWLQDNGYIREVPAAESGVRRYTLTEKGRKLLEEQRKLCVQLAAKRKFLFPPLLEYFYPCIPPEEAEEVRNAFRRLFKAFFSLRMGLEERFSEQAVKEISSILNETAQKLEDIEKRLRGELDDGGSN